MTDDITKKKLEVAIDFICRLYKLDIITAAYIVGSIAGGTARDDSDIDLNIVSPQVTDKYSGELTPEIDDNTICITKKIGAKFDNENYLIYGNEKFHIFVWNEFNPAMEVIDISKQDCK